ncbi:MAG: mechanosensitive ion channel [Thermodesulfobacteriota bacterium]|nr:mechanosensitive ion channel [Thermodesulfobacteriota bacterium]
MEPLWNQVLQLLKTNIPTFIGALAILIIGCLVAFVIAALVRAVLRRTTLDERMTQLVMGEKKGEKVNTEEWIARSVFYVIMIFVVITFLQFMNFTVTTEPLNQLLTQIFAFAPRLFAAGILLFVAWLMASLFKRILMRILDAAKIDERLGNRAGIEEDKRIPLTKTFSEATYWLVFLLFLPAVLSTLALEGLLEPVRGMLDVILNFLPNILSAVLIVALGWLIARIMQRIVANFLSAIGTESLSEKIGLAPALGAQGLSGVIGLIVYVMILIPVIIAALNALELEALTTPASDVLAVILGSFPVIFAACMLVAIAFFVGRVVARLITDVLTGIGFNTLLARIGIGKEPAEGQLTLSAVVGKIVLVVIMLFAAIEGSDLIGFNEFADLLVQLLVFTGHVLFGLAIFVIGLYLARFASNAIQASVKTQANLIALSARISIIVVASAIALRQMGVANEIIVLAFGLVLGAIAIAIAIAFGIGGREIAAKQLDEWVKSIKSSSSDKS